MFAGSFFGLLFISTQFEIPGLARYDLAEIERMQSEATVTQLRAELKVANDELAKLRVSGAAMAQALYGEPAELDRM